MFKVKNIHKKVATLEFKVNVFKVKNIQTKVATLDIKVNVFKVKNIHTKVATLDIKVNVFKVKNIQTKLLHWIPRSMCSRLRISRKSCYIGYRGQCVQD